MLGTVHLWPHILLLTPEDEGFDTYSVIKQCWNCINLSKEYKNHSDL